MNIQDLGQSDYREVYKAMKEWSSARTADSEDEIWVVEHPPVYTLGQAGDPAHLLSAHNIPLVQVDRGGQITYHGPGQLVVYPLLKLSRYGLKVREYVNLLETIIIDSLSDIGVAQAQRKPGAPGVYIPKNNTLVKIAALGIKVTRGFTYHGLSLNVDMDLTPFGWINPCGYEGLETVDIASTGVKISFHEMQTHLVKKLVQQLEQLEANQFDQQALEAGVKE